MTTDNLDIFGEPVEPLSAKTANKAIRSWCWRTGAKPENLYHILSVLDVHSKNLADKICPERAPATMATRNTLAHEAYKLMSNAQQTAEYATIAHMEH